MKKTYIKPQIVYESFQLSTSIANGCELYPTTSAQYFCPVEDIETGFLLFADSAASPCDTAPPDGSQICYDVPTANWNVLLS